jgi:hypothetical protein
MNAKRALRMGIAKDKHEGQSVSSTGDGLGPQLVSAVCRIRQENGGNTFGQAAGQYGNFHIARSGAFYTAGRVRLNRKLGRTVEFPANPIFKSVERPDHEEVETGWTGHESMGVPERYCGPAIGVAA